MNRNPAPATVAALAAMERKGRERLEDWVYLRCFGLPIGAAAEHMGFDHRQGDRYEAMWKLTSLRWPPREDGEPCQPPAPSEPPALTAPPRDPLEPAADGSRGGCGTYLSWRLHEILGEHPCKVCVDARSSEAAAMRDAAVIHGPDWELLREGIPARPSPPPPYPPVTAAEAAEHLAALTEVAEDVDWGRGRDLNTSDRARAASAAIGVSEAA